MESLRKDRPMLDRLRRPVETIRFLIVEDDTALREQVVRAVSDWGFHPTAAWSGEDAIGLSAADGFDIALLDLCLPGMDGIETLNHLRTHSPQLQGIILTGSATIAAAKRAMHLDVVEFLTKPANRGELEQAIERARRRLPIVLPKRDLSPPAVPAPASVTLDNVERQHILAALERNQGDRRATAAQLGITRKTLYNRIKRYVALGFANSWGSGEPGSNSKE
jgi:DNA-binding NtrC family response regulator